MVFYECDERPPPDGTVAADLAFIRKQENHRYEGEEEKTEPRRVDETRCGISVFHALAENGCYGAARPVSGAGSTATGRGSGARCRVVRKLVQSISTAAAQKGKRGSIS